MMKKESVINDYYLKCIVQKDDINNKITEVHTGMHNEVLEKIREKIYEKYENFLESLKTIEKLQTEHNGTPDEILVWKKKIENLKISSHKMQKDIDRAINTQRQKNNMKNLLKNGPNMKYDNNLTNLYEEKKSIDHSIRISNEIRETGMNILNQLELQETYLERIKGKVFTMFNKIEISNSITQFLIRRGKSDLALFFVLAFITLVIIYYTYYHLRPKLYGLGTGTETGTN